MKGTITVECGKQKSIIEVKMLDDKIEVKGKFIPEMDMTKTPTMEENFVGNITSMLLMIISGNDNVV